MGMTPEQLREHDDHTKKIIDEFLDPCETCPHRDENCLKTNAKCPDEE
jgi:hypothetical protein